MIAVGAVASGVAAAALALAVRRTSGVGRVLSKIAPRAPSVRPRTAPYDMYWSVRAIGAGCGGLVGALALLALPLGPLAPVVGAGAGALGPGIVLDRRARHARDRADARVASLVEWLESLLASGRPAESAMLVLALRATGAHQLDSALRAAADAYAMGVPMARALADAATARGLPTLAGLAAELERSRELGRGAMIAIRDYRERLRSRDRARLLEASSRVDGALMLVLVCCYLPALMLLVVIPLFVDLLTALDAVVP